MTTVYVSATHADLAECRETIRLVCERLGIEDVAMESYVANTAPPLTKCLEDVARCELYIGLFAWRYGFTPPGEQLSITELEYRRARDLDKPCLIFLLKEDAPWPGNLVDQGADGERMAALRKELAENHVCSFFRGADDLAALATAALANRRHGQPLPVAPSRSLVVTETVPAQGNWKDYYARLRQRCLGVELDALTPAPTTEFLRILLTSVFLEPNARPDARPEMPRQRRAPGESGDQMRAPVPDVGNPVDLTRLHASYQATPSSPLFDLLTDPGRRAMVLLGDPGAGKSAVTRYVALCLAGEHDEPRLRDLEGYVPLLVELRTYLSLVDNGKCEGFIEYLDHRCRTDGLGVDKIELRRYLANGGPALVLFDGLDEIFEPQRREEVANQIAAFTVMHPSVRVLVTARVVGYNRRTLSDAGFDHFTLEDLDEPQIGEFLSRWYEQVNIATSEDAGALRRRMLSTIRSSPAIRELAGNPLLLSILAIIGKNEELPKERWHLYDHAANVLVEYWDANRHLREYHGNATFIDTDDKKKLLRRLAYRMQSQQRGLNPNYIDHDQLSRLFEDYLVERYEHPRATAHLLANSMIDQFHQRNFILGEYGQHMYGFVHRTFLEFFYAQSVVRKFQQQDPEWPMERLTELVVEHWADPSWREVLRLLVGALDVEAAGSLIRLLATGVNRPWPPDEFAEPPWNLALAAQCLAELRAPADVAAAAQLVLRQLILLIEHGVSLEDRNTAELIEGEILPAVRVVGANWPGRQAYLRWYRRRGVAVSWTTGSAFGTQVAVLLSAPQERIEDYLDTTLGAINDRRARLALIAGLAESAALPSIKRARQTQARQSRCRALLTERARSDAHGAARLAALAALVAHFTIDASLNELLSVCARTDAYSEVRLMAIHTLGNRRVLPETDRALLIERAAADVDGPVRRAALQSLGRRLLNDDDVRNLLIDRVRSDSDVGVLQSAAHALAGLPDAGPHLRSLLANRLRSDPEDAIRRAAARLLGESFTDYDTRELLLDRARHDSDPGTRNLALAGLMRMPDDGSLRGLLMERIAEDDDADLRLAVQRTLVDRYPDDPAIGAILVRRVREDRDANVRQTAVRDLAEQVGDATALTALIQTAREDTAAGVRLAAAAMLAEHFTAEPDTHMVIIHQATTERDPMVRLAAIRQLVRFDPDPAIRDHLLDRVRTDADPQVIRESAGALASLPTYQGMVLDALRERAGGDTYAGVRLAAVEILVAAGDTGSATVTALVDRAERDSDPAVFRAAVTGLIERFDWRPSAVETLRRHADSPDSLIRLPAIELLGTYFGADTAVRARLIACARTDGDIHVRRAALDVLGRELASHASVRKLLRDLVSDPDWSLRCAAVRFLGRCAGADADVRALFIDLATNDPNPDFRQIIGQTLTWLPDADPDLLPAIADITV